MVHPKPRYVVSLPFLSSILTLISQCAASLTPLIPLLASIVENRPCVRVRVHIFYTRATGVTFDGMYLPQGITLLPGRPNLGNLLGEAITNTMSAGGTNGLFVGVCGPVALARTTARVVKEVDTHSRTAVGGVELHEETFGW